MTAKLVPTPPLEAPSPYRSFIRSPGQKIGAIHVPSPDNDVPVQAHVLLLRSSVSNSVPRIFVHQGDMGAGKTYVCANAVLAIRNTALMLVPPSVFGSPHEGGGVAAFDAIMEEAASYSRAFSRYIATLFDDLDASELSHTDKTGHTTNPVALAGHVQNVAEHREKFTDFTGKPIPILVTANAPKRMRPSMFRAMRATIHTHVDDPTAKLEMVIQAFQPHGAAERDIIHRLVRKYRAQSMAFFAAVHADWHTAHTKDAIRRHGLTDDVVETALATRNPLDEATLFRLAAARRDSTLGDFIFNLGR